MTTTLNDHWSYNWKKYWIILQITGLIHYFMNLLKIMYLFSNSFGCAGSWLLRGLPPGAESRAHPLVVMHGPPSVVASPCRAQARMLYAMWDLPGSGIEPASPI